MGTIGIIGAMEVEVKELKEQMQITRQLTKAGRAFWKVRMLLWYAAVLGR